MRMNLKKQIPRKSRSKRLDELAMIHIGKKQLEMTEMAYRRMISVIGGAVTASSKDLDAIGRRRVIDFLKEIGFKPVHGSAKNSGMHLPPCEDRAAQLSKVGACLADMGLPWSYADAIAKQMFKVEFVRWLQPMQLQKVIAAIVTYQNRQRTR